MRQDTMMRCLVLTGCVLSVASASHAQVAFNTFGPEVGYDPLFMYSLQGSATTSPLRLGWRFTSAADGAVSGLDAAIFTSAPSTPVSVELWSDSSGLPGAMIGSWVFPSVVYAGGLPALPAGHLSIANGPVLAAGTDYHFVVARQANNGSVRWFLNPLDLLGTQVSTATVPPFGWTSSADREFAAFRVTVPSPGAGAVVAGAGMVMMARRRRRRGAGG